MALIDCSFCGAHNRPEAPRCMRCGKPLERPDTAAAAHARAFVQRELAGAFLGAEPRALDFSADSLIYLDALITQMWGPDGEAPGDSNWQPSATRLPTIVNFGAYLGEVLCRTLPAHWEMDPRDPEVVIAARVVDRQNRRINTFAQVGARFRDGADCGLDSLLAALTGRPQRRLAVSVSTPSPFAPRPAPARAPEPPRVDPASLLADAHARAGRGDFSAAITLYQRVLTLQPGNAEARLQLAMGLAKTGAIADSLAQLDELKRQRPDDLQVADTRAVVLAQAGRFDEAIGTLDMALMRHPGELSLRRRRGFIRLKTGPAAGAQGDLEQAIASNPNDAEALIGLAQCLHSQGQSDAASRHLRAVLNLSPNDCPPTLANAARERLQQLFNPAAPVPASSPVRTPASDAASVYQLAVQHARERRFDAALPHFLEAARLAPERAAYLKDVGNCLFDLGKTEEARAWLLRSLSLEPQLSPALWLLALAEEKLGRRAAAIVIYRGILAGLNSEQRYVDLAFDRLQALGALPGA